MSFDPNLRFLESLENLKRLVRQRTGRILATARAQEIAACIQQGRQFYEAANVSPLEIRPLQQFYGMVGFGKALILARRLSALSTLKPSHGVRDISAPNDRLAELRLRIEKSGTFQEFNNEVSGLNRVCYFGVNAQPRSICIPSARSEHVEGSEISLKEILARIPGLDRLYRSTFDEDPCAESLRHLYYQEGDDHFTVTLVDRALFSDRASLENMLGGWRRRFPYLSRWRVMEASHSWGNSYITLANLPQPKTGDLSEEALAQHTDGRFYATNRANSDQKPASLPLEKIMEGPGGGYSESDPWAIAPLHGHYLSEYALHYLGLFLLSSLVRYRPDAWGHAVSRTSRADKPADDQALALIERFLHLNHGAIPGLIVQAINPNEDRYA